VFIWYTFFPVEVMFGRVFLLYGCLFCRAFSPVEVMFGRGFLLWGVCFVELFSCRGYVFYNFSLAGVFVW